MSLNVNRNAIERSFERISKPFEHFISKQTTAGILLLISAFVSVLIANSHWNYLMDAVLSADFGFVVNNSRMALSLGEWISSGLMALFFFLIGLEIKREMLAGGLQDIKVIAPIFFGAVGGMVLPATIYWIANGDSDGVHGWAIPMATDTAFALAAMALCTKHIIHGVSVFLAALAIFDDVGAVLVVALFYTHEVDFSRLVQALFPLLSLYSLNLLGVRRGWLYFIFGVLLWWYIYLSGVHATLAGLLMALTVPARPELAQRNFIKSIRVAISVFEQKIDFGRRILEVPTQHSLTMDIERAAKSAGTPLQRWHSFLLNPVGIIVLPLFAFFNAGIEIPYEGLKLALSSPVTMGVVAGLAIGKPLGIWLLAIATLKSGLGKLPAEMSLRDLTYVSFLSGIGFTMSLFITSLSFQDHPQLILQAKLGIFIGSIFSFVMAYFFSFIVKNNK